MKRNLQCCSRVALQWLFSYTEFLSAASQPRRLFGGGGRRLLTFCLKCGAYSRAALTRGGALIRVNTVTPLSGGGGVTGVGRPGEMGAGSVREAGEEGAGSGIPKVAGSGRKREKLRNIAQYFAIEKMQRGGSQQIQGGNRD